MSLKDYLKNSNIYFDIINDGIKIYVNRKILQSANVIIGDKSFKLTNGKHKLDGLSYFSEIKEKDVYLEFTLFGYRLKWKVPKNSIKGNLFKKRLYLTDDYLIVKDYDKILLKIESGLESLIIDYINPYNIDIDLFVAIQEMDRTYVQYRIENNELTFEQIKNLLDPFKEGRKIIFLSKNNNVYNKLSIVTDFLDSGFEIGDFILSGAKNFLKIKKGNNKYKMQLPALMRRTLTSNNYESQEVFYDSKSKMLILDFDKIEQPYDTVQVILENSNNLDTYLFDEFKAKNRYCLNIDELNNIVPLNKTDLYHIVIKFFHNNKMVVSKYLKVNFPISKDNKDYIIASLPNYGLVTFNQYSRLVEIINAENIFFYQSKLKYDLVKSTIQSNVELCSMNVDNFTFEMSVKSLLSKIKSITVYAMDNYSKNSYFIDYIDNIYNRIYKGEVVVNVIDLYSKLYYNARIDVMCKIEYVSGYVEISNLVNNAKMETEDRLKYFHQIDENLGYSPYFSVNSQNFVVWFTSPKEYNEGTRFLIAKDAYDQSILREEISNKTIIFEAFLGKTYAGSPKYIYEFMINDKRFKDFDFVWSYSGNEKIPGNPLIVERGSKEYFSYLAEAKLWVNNIIFPVKTKRKDVIYLQTWHGTPLKKLGFDIEVDGPEKRSFGNLYQESQNWDYLLVDNDYGESKLVNAFRFKKEVIKKGYPINDIFYNTELQDKSNSKHKKVLDWANGRKILLYAPTWRDLDGNYKEGFEFNLPFDVESYKQELGDDYVIILKMHHLISNNFSIDDSMSDFIMDCSMVEDVQELLIIADALITDYSSVFYDYANARKPIYFYMYDKESYLTEARGLYISVDELPGPIIENEKELLYFLNDKNLEKYAPFKNKLDAFCNQMTKYDHGKSSEDIVNIIMEDLKWKR